MKKNVKQDFDKQVSSEFWDIIKEMINLSDGRLRLASAEKDDSNDPAFGVAHFLKLDGKRIGKDIEVYLFLGQCIAGWHSALDQFTKDMISPISGALPEIPEKINEKIKRIRDKTA